MKRFLRRCFRQGVQPFRGLGLGRIPMVRLIERAVRDRLREDVAEVMGHKMHVGTTDVLDLSLYGIHEPLATDIICKQVNAGDVVLDVGAHVGYYTLILARLVGLHGKVFAFEPEPENFSCLQKNVAENDYSNVIRLQKAVSNRTARTRLYLSEDNAADHRLYGAMDARKSIEIETIALDEYFRKYTGRFGFVKMDIQGAEHVALQGMLGLLETGRITKLMMEFWPGGLLAGGVRPEEPLTFLFDKGFKLFDVDELERRVVPMSVPQLMHKYAPGKRGYTNVLCVRVDADPLWMQKHGAS